MSDQRLQSGLRVAVVGATGAVGQVLLRVLEERSFPVGELRPLASRDERTLRFRGAEVAVAEARPEQFEGCDLVFFAATGSLSRQLAPQAVERGAIVIDKSGSWRMHDDVALVVPEINADALTAEPAIVSSPNCTTVGIALALEPIRRVAGLRRVLVTTLQAASGAGRDGLNELRTQLAGESAEASVFAAPLAHNLVPLCDELDETGATGEEIKIRDETRKILGLPALEISASCVRVPVAVGHAASMWIETERPIDASSARRALAGFPGIRLADDLTTDELPTPLAVEGSDDVIVGRIRSDARGLWLWQVSDNLRKGAATNAVQIAEALLAGGSLRAP